MYYRLKTESYRSIEHCCWIDFSCESFNCECWVRYSWCGASHYVSGLILGWMDVCALCTS